MDFVTSMPTSAVDQAASIVGSRAQSASRCLSAVATYLLSEEGRKASLLAGGDGRAVQTLTMDVPASRLHLVSVDRQGVARLRLRPRFEVDASQRVVRVDSAPAFDAPPTSDELLRIAARNHELEQTYHSERTAAVLTKQDAHRELRERVAQAFLADQAQRALPHPPPTQRRCCIQAEGRRIVFDVAEDPVLAKGIAAEATRRFRADQRAKREQNLQERAKQLALNEEKKRFVADWIAAHGTTEQQGRQAAGVLPMAEAVEAIADETFLALESYARLVHDGVERLQCLAAGVSDEGRAVRSADLCVESGHAPTATAEEWAMLQDVERRIPAATVVLLRHRLTLRTDSSLAAEVHGILVTVKRGPLALRREFAAPGA